MAWLRQLIVNDDQTCQFLRTARGFPRGDRVGTLLVLDVVIKGGTLVDGTGAPPRTAGPRTLGGSGQ